jgi:predicted PurR-regulated permease PerM
MPETRTTSSTYRGQSRHPRTSSWGRWAAVGAAAIILAVVLVAGFYLTARTLALLFAAIVVAEALAPVVERLARRMPRGVAVSLVYLILIALVVALLWILIPNITEQARSISDEIPAFAEEVQNRIESWNVSGGQDFLNTISQGIGQFASALVTFSTTLVSSVAQIVLVAFMSAYWLMSRSSFFKFIRSLAPEEQHDAVDGTLDAFSETVGGYIRGVVISAILTGTLSFIGLSIIGVDYALVLALVAAFGEFLPILGPILVAVPAVLVALFNSPVQAVIVAVFYLVLQQIESNIIMPNVMSNQADVPPLLTIVAISAGGTIGGILGALIAIPLAGVLKVMVTQVAAPAIRRWTGATQSSTTVTEALEE